MDEEPSDELTPDVLTYFCQHLVGFSWYEGKANQRGDFRSKPAPCIASGFIVEIGKTWMLATAGHVYSEHEERMRKEGAATAKTELFDIWSPQSTVSHPIPFDFFDPSLEKMACYDDELGLDFALVPMPILIGQALAQTITPFRRKDWLTAPSIDFDFYAMLGIPAAWAEERTWRDDSRSYIDTQLHPGLIFLERLNWPCPGVNETKLPQFAAKINAKAAVETIVGMSGGPILGFKKENGQLRYFPVAIQSRWSKTKRIVVGCPLDVVGNAAESFLKELATEDDNSTSQS